jgi:predicted permease
MRTALFFLTALLLLAACLVLGKLFSSNYPAATTVATVVYVALWLVIAAFNLWTGVAKAGYSFAEELPVFALIFLVPAAVAILVRWRFF